SGGGCCSGLVEVGVPFAGDEPALGRIEHRAPPCANQPGAGAHLRDRPRRRKWLEGARACIVIEIEAAHASSRTPSRTPRGSASMRVFKSDDRSTVVTSTTPRSTTTTSPTQPTTPRLRPP